MNRMIDSTRRLLTLALAGVLAFASLGFAPIAASAATQGTNGWYWPVKAERFRMSGWWDKRPGAWHLAQDMGAPYGASVYAIADGVVLESKYTGGYGPGGTSGGAVVILHTDYRGTKFKALYGHLYALKYHKGDRVKAGAVIGRINGANPHHLHFGINPGSAYPSDRNPFRGHTYTSSNLYGFVDPIAFLKSHFRLDPYRAPAIPVVGSVLASGPVLWARAANGILYWADSAPSSPGAWAAELPTGTPVSIDDTTTLPLADENRYTLRIGEGELPTITVTDRLPRLTLLTSDAAPASGSSFTLSGTVRNSADAPFAYPALVLERANGEGWERVARVYGSSRGAWSYTMKTDSTVKLRVSFIPPQDYAPATSAVLTITHAE